MVKHNTILEIREKFSAFTLVEMMVVMLILSIVLAASMPLITKRTNTNNNVIYKVITVQVPAETQSAKTSTIPNLSQESNIIQDNKNINNLTVESKQILADTANTQISSKTQTNIIQSNILNQDVTNIETISDKLGNPQTVVTLTSGKKVTVLTDENGQPVIKEYK